MEYWFDISWVFKKLQVVDNISENVQDFNKNNSFL